MSRWTKDTFENTPEQIGKVMHAEFSVGRTHMSGADNFDSKEVNTDIKPINLILSRMMMDAVLL